MKNISEALLIDSPLLTLEFGKRLVSDFDAMKSDLESAGIPGLIGLLSAVIERYSLNRKDLLSFGRQFCPQRYYAILRELLDVFQGDDPKQHRWTVKPDGTYALLA